MFICLDYLFKYACICIVDIIFEMKTAVISFSKHSGAKVVNFIVDFPERNLIKGV